VNFSLLCSCNAQPYHVRFAAIATDGHLEPLDDGVSWIIKADRALLDGMDEW
jgi:oligoribonuclease (3'-5' exoribonuclease)